MAMLNIPGNSVPSGHILELIEYIAPEGRRLDLETCNVGAGHIAVPLAAIAKINEFEVTVLDDRPQYAHSARFPTADRVIAGPFRAESGL